MCIKSITTYTLNYKINVLSIPPLKEWAFRTFVVSFFALVLHMEYELNYKNGNLASCTKHYITVSKNVHSF